MLHWFVPIFLLSIYYCFEKTCSQSFCLFFFGSNFCFFHKVWSFLFVDKVTYTKTSVIRPSFYRLLFTRQRNSSMLFAQVKRQGFRLSAISTTTRFIFVSTTENEKIRGFTDYQNHDFFSFSVDSIEGETLKFLLTSSGYL